MKRLFTLLLLLLLSAGAFAQAYYNEWIDFSKTYFKFKVGSTGLYRIPQSVLANAGMGGVPGQNFQLWRNGKEVPIFVNTANPTLPLAGSDYIEFWGLKNDGVPDNPLYRSPSYQHTQQLSLETDTAVFFLVENTAGNAFHYANVPNNVSGSLLSPETSFQYTAGSYFKSIYGQPNPGFAQMVGEAIYSSSYDIGEFWASDLIYPSTGPFTDSKNGLFVYTGAGAPDASIKYGVAGASDYPRQVQVTVNGSQVDLQPLVSFNDLLTTKTVPLSVISGGTINVAFTNIDATNSTTDRMVASFYELTYPRQWNFGGQSNFTFQLPAKSSGYLLNISNFAIAGGISPILYDMTDGSRYAGVVSGSTVSFAVAGLSSTHTFVLVNEDASTVKTVTSLTPKRFIDYNNTANQGNYIIISSSYLYTGTNGNNPVQDYRNYRASIAGGSFAAQTYDMDELVDQFAFGIKRHPLSIQNFLRFARAKFTAKPQYVLLIGHGMVYSDYYAHSEINHDPVADQLNMVPTFGNPASDNKLSVNNGVDAVPITPIGRVSAVNGGEVEDFLNKVKEYEKVQTTSPNTIAGRLWMKNFVHLTGVSEASLGTILCNYMQSYGQIVADTLYGASVSLFCDGNASAVTQVPANVISQLFSNGFSVLNYFGHSSNAVLGYNLENPNDYNNAGKYPIFYVNGCNAGDFFVYDGNRLPGTVKTLSELYVLAKERGAIAFVASTHFGIVNYLNILLYGLYNLIDKDDYGKPMGIIQKDALQSLMNAAPNDYFARLHAEEMTIHGDPFIKLNQGETDYDVESSTVQVNPSFVSVNNNTFTVKAKFYNLGKAVGDSVLIQVQRTYPNGATDILLKKKIRGIRLVDSISLDVPIIATRDKGDNKITVSINPTQAIPEVTYSNNTVVTDVFIYQDGASPVYPYDFSIINTPTAKLVASTTNPFSASGTYTMQIDTTQSFNSPLKVERSTTGIGGVLEFDPGISFIDSAVYYWRVGIPNSAQAGQMIWNNASFVYIDPAHSSTGSNQSHYFQHLYSKMDSIAIGSNRSWAYTQMTHNVYLKNEIYAYQSSVFDNDFSTTVDGNEYMMSACLGSSLVFNVINPVTFSAWKNVDANRNNLNLYGSADANCSPGRDWNFEFSYLTPASRKLMMDFMDLVPNGFIVAVHSYDFNFPGSFSSTWEADTAMYGSGKSLYHYLLNAGFTQIDSLNTVRGWTMVYKKGDPSLTKYAYTKDPADKITVSADFVGPNYTAFVTSPVFGPAKAWQSMHWRGHSVSSPVTDTVGVQVIGIDTLGVSTTLYRLNRSTTDLDISSVIAKQYPYIKLMMTTTDSVNAKPFQLDTWRLNYTPAPEGALAPNILFKSVDTVALGQDIPLTIAFKNVSPYKFEDSMQIRMYILDKSNVMHPITLPRKKPLISGDTITLSYLIDSKPYAGANTIYLNFNPDNAQPEQYTFNNFLYKSVYVRNDGRSPDLDVTFDNVHILNNDIVSARPHIQIKLQSQSQYLLLTDTSLIKVQLKYPDGSLRPFYFNTDTLRFTPATASNNVATVDFTPAFLTQYNAQGDNYELIVTGKDQLGNTFGTIPYRVDFMVITKPMISNMLNYPNPFTTSTAFVFTITGSDVPQNIKIQILTITGKVVREITKDELGPLHVGRNITEFKWNGTDMYGSRLANGVYLYHVVTNLNGQSLSKYKAAGDNTDKFFNNGYGKMYLMK